MVIERTLLNISLYVVHSNMLLDHCWVEIVSQWLMRRDILDDIPIIFVENLNGLYSFIPIINNLSFDIQVDYAHYPYLLTNYIILIRSK